MSYNHLTINDREMLLLYDAKDLSIRGIALKLNRSPRTISRELRKLSGSYSPAKS